MSTTVWTVAEAKARFSELLQRAQAEGPQRITRHGRTTAVVVSPSEWEKKNKRKGNLAEFLMNSPLRNSGLRIKRLRGGLRKVDL
ncbi:MAG: type II toxin-antitoxin system Phd/YefM family antitoxin [Acidobacteriaceae bacterium]